MPRTVAEKLADAVRLFTLPREQRAYLRLLRGHAAFDRGFYIAANPRLHPLFRAFPERHYIREGEGMGLMPNPTFSPYAYLAQNPDLAGRGIRPLRHWIERGAAEGRVTLADRVADPVPAMPGLGPGDRPARPAPVAVALHLYYPDLWEEVRDRLAAQEIAFDLYVTLTGPAAADPALAGRIAADRPGARVWTLPNRGRDILPFLHLVNSGLFRGYSAVCKLHGKKSPHRRDGDAWRGALLDGVLGPPEATRARLDAFLADAQAGLWTAEGQVHEGEDWWGANRALAEGILGRIGAEPRVPLRFPAGSVYWLKPGVLDRLAALDLGAGDFGPELGLVDGTPAHAMERAMGDLTAAAGLRLITAGTLDAAAKRDGLSPRDRP